MDRRPLSSLAKERSDYSQMSEDGHGWGMEGWNWANVLLWFVIIAVIVWFVLYSVKPTMVQKTDGNGNTTGEVDNGKVLLWSVIIAIIVIVIIWLIRYSTMGY